MKQLMYLGLILVPLFSFNAWTQDDMEEVKIMEVGMDPLHIDVESWNNEIRKIIHAEYFGKIGPDMFVWLNIFRVQDSTIHFALAPSYKSYLHNCDDIQLKGFYIDHALILIPEQSKDVPIFTDTDQYFNLEICKCVESPTKHCRMGSYHHGSSIHSSIPMK